MLHLASPFSTESVSLFSQEWYKPFFGSVLLFLQLQSQPTPNGETARDAASFDAASRDAARDVSNSNPNTQHNHVFLHTYKYMSEFFFLFFFFFSQNA